MGQIDFRRFSLPTNGTSESLLIETKLFLQTDVLKTDELCCGVWFWCTASAVLLKFVIK